METPDETQGIETELPTETPPPVDPREEIRQRQRAAAQVAYDAEIELTKIDFAEFTQNRTISRVLATVVASDGNTRQFEILPEWLKIP